MDQKLDNIKEILNTMKMWKNVLHINIVKGFYVD